jgi:HEAT repeat protein
MRRIACTLLALALCLPALRGEDDEQVLAAARAADLFYQNQFITLVDQLQSPDEQVRITTLSALGHLADPASVPRILPFLQASNRTPAEIIAAANALSTSGAESALPTLHNLLKHPDASVRVTAMNVLTRIKAIAAADYKARAVDTEGSIRASSAVNLGTPSQADAVAILAAALAKDERPHIRRMCAIGLGQMGDRTQGPNLSDALADSNPGVRRYAAEALVKLNYTPAIPNLLMAMEANVAGDHIARCLTLMTKQDFGFDARSSPLARAEAIEKGFKWWTENSKDLNK